MVKAVRESPANVAAYNFSAVEVERRLVWMDAKVCKLHGQLEEAARLCILFLHLYDHVYPGEDKPRHPSALLYKVSHQRKVNKRTSKNSTQIEKKLFAEFVMNNMTMTFLSLAGVKAAVQTAADCLLELGDYAAFDRFIDALTQTRIYVSNKKKGSEKKQKLAGNASIAGQNVKRKTVYSEEVLEPVANGKIGRHEYPDYMSESVARDHLSAVEAFQPKWDHSLLAGWRSLEELVGETQAAVLEGDDDQNGSSKNLGPSVVAEVIESVLEGVDGVVEEEGARVVNGVFDGEGIADKGGSAATAKLVGSILSGIVKNVATAGEDVAAPPAAASNLKESSPSGSGKVTPMSASFQNVASKFYQSPAISSYKLNATARFEAVEKMLLFQVGSLHKVKGSPAASEFLVSACENVAKASACLACSLENGVVSSSVGSVGDLLEGVKLISEAYKEEEVSDAASILGPDKKDDERVRYDLNRSSFFSLRKLNILKQHSNLNLSSAGSADTLALCKLARKQRNYKAASRLLDRAPQSSTSFAYERAALSYDVGTNARDYGKRVEGICEMLQIADSAPDHEHYKLRSFLRAAKWLHAADKTPDSGLTKISEVCRSLKASCSSRFDAIPETAVFDTSLELSAKAVVEQEKNPMKPNIMMEGQCLKYACELSPTKGKPFLRLADWAFGLWFKYSTEKVGPAAAAASKDVIFTFHKLSFENYCKFLNLGGSPVKVKSSVTIVVLRLLKMIVQRPRPSGGSSDDLSDSLVRNLNSTPAENFVEIIPQLMSLAGHQDVVTRNVAVSSLIRCVHVSALILSLVCFVCISPIVAPFSFHFSVFTTNPATCTTFRSTYHHLASCRKSALPKIKESELMSPLRPQLQAKLRSRSITVSP